MSDPASPPLHEVRAPRIVHLLSLLATLGLVAVFVWFLHVREFPPGEGPPAMFRVVFGFFTVVGVFLSVVFARRFIARPASFWFNAEGFVYRPGGVSTGLIRWDDVIELKEETVLTNNGAGRTPRREAVIAVVLRNPEAYGQRHPGWLKPLFALRARLNSSALLLRPADLGRDPARVKAMMDECVRRAPRR